MKYDLINNNIYVYNNIVSKDYDKINNISDLFINNYKAKNFSDLFSNSRTSRGTTNGTSNANGRVVQQTPIITPTVPVQPQPVDQKPVGKAYDASTRWSPESFVGKKYEWDRGVFGISPDGYVEKEKIDGTVYHHAGATVRVVRRLGGDIELTDMPFAAAIEGTKQDFLIFQSEGDNALVYFPASISEEQYTELEKAIIPRSSFNFSFTHNEEIFEEQSMQAVLNYAKGIITLSQGVAKL